MESEPSRQRFTPSRSMYMVGLDGSEDAWCRISQSTSSPICIGVLTISVLISCMSVKLWISGCHRRDLIWSDKEGSKTCKMFLGRHSYKFLKLFVMATCRS